MNAEDKIKDSIEFVGSHYDEDAFDASRTLRSIGFEKRRAFRFNARNIAAAVATIAIAASACILIYNTSSKVESPAVEQKVETKTVSPVEISHKIEFNDASILTVAAEIEKIYGVEIENLPEEDYRLTLSYEGNARDLVETINELLGTHITIRNADTDTH